MQRKNFSTKKQIDSYLKALDTDREKYFIPDKLENDYVPDLGNISIYNKKKISRYPISKRYLYFQKLKDEAQGCQLCGKKTNNLVIDHEHWSKKIRGVLCQNCNHGLGKFLDSPELMRKAADYVENFKRDEAVDYYNSKGPQ